MGSPLFLVAPTQRVRSDLVLAREVHGLRTCSPFSIAWAALELDIFQTGVTSTLTSRLRKWFGHGKPSDSHCNLTDACVVTTTSK